MVRLLHNTPSLSGGLFGSHWELPGLALRGRRIVAARDLSGPMMLGGER